MAGPPPPLFTIGYEGLVQDQLLDFLTANGVRILLDVRAIAASRKAGFSKSVLAASLAQRGISYCHERSLGTPKPGRLAVRAGHPEAMRAIFADHMKTATAQEGLARATELAGGQRICLLCFEREPHDCHRSIVAMDIAQVTGQLVRHL